MSLVEKLQAEILIMAPPHKFHEVFWCRPHHFSNVCPEMIQKVHLHEGDWGNPGSIIEWNYVMDGKNHATKEILEAVDEENKSVTFKVIEGDLTKEYKNFKFIIQAIPKRDATYVHWTLEYEKFSKDIPPPVKMLEFVIQASEHLDDHLIQA